VIRFGFYIADSGVCDISTDCFYSYDDIIRMCARGVGGVEFTLLLRSYDIQVIKIRSIKSSIPGYELNP
jgi:hypothetical protein